MLIRIVFKRCGVWQGTKHGCCACA